MNAPLPVIEWRFYRSAGLISQAISWFGADHYSHVDVVGPDGMLWGAHSDAIKPAGYAKAIDPGFQKRPPYYDKWIQITAFALTVTPVQYARFWDFTGQQIGKRYDRISLVETFVLGRDWRDPSAWFCSEEQAAAAEYATIVPVVWKHVNAIDPGDFALMLNMRGANHWEVAPEAPTLQAVA